jgi:hypothetical protein
MQFLDEVSALQVYIIDEPGSDLDWLAMVNMLNAVADAFILFQYYVFLLCYEDLSLLPPNHLKRPSASAL